MDNPVTVKENRVNHQMNTKVLIAANGIHRNTKVRVSLVGWSDFFDPWRPMSSC